MIKDIDVKLFKEFKKRSKTMQRDELYYTLLDWADQHPEIKNEYIKSIDTYAVICKWNDSTGEHQNTKLFTAEDGNNPYFMAKMFYRAILSRYKIVELWQKGNEFNEGDKLIMRNIVD